MVSILLLIITAPGVTRSQENGATDREAAFRQIVQSYVEAGKGEYNKGYYEQAAKTFVMAQGYQEYLTPSGREELRAHLEKAQSAVAKRKLALEKFQTVDDLIKQDQLIEAKTHLENLRNNEFLTKDERAQITSVLKQIDFQITEDKAYSEKVKNRKRLTAEKLDKIAGDIKQPSKQPGQNQKIAELY
ncbi:MAG TPA: hypothetical protein DIU00_00915, partial [Phycisphaerales bacterium]|nr:hypothetical protein [Phycisphaerales bacterium]